MYVVAVPPMEPNCVVSFRHRRSPSSDRFLDVFAQPKWDSVACGAFRSGYELHEDEVFWTGDFAEPNQKLESPSDEASGNQNKHHKSFRKPENSGILAALAEDSRKPNRPLIYRKPSISSSSRLFPAIPKPPPEREYSQSMPSRKFHQSTPMTVPMMPKKVQGNSVLAEAEFDYEEDDEMLLPPHEIVARGSAKSPKTTFSVLEGVGRTLKGRDLRQVRNAVWRRTGFLD